VRVEDRIRKSVVFIGIEGERGFVPLGTGFVCISVYEGLAATVIVTAEHVIQSISGDKVSVRLNRHSSPAEVVKINKTPHIVCKEIDVAIFAYRIDPTIYDVAPFTLDRKKWEMDVEKIWKPGPGDEVSIVGLYTTHYGHVKNIPIVRIGHIAALPEEKVMTHRGYIHGYLIEPHSIAGLSGSPVFVNVPRSRVVNDEIEIGLSPAYIMIGLLIGYHTIESREDEILVPQFQVSEEDREYIEASGRPEERRTGFGVVVPIEFVMAFFEGDMWMNSMKKSVEQHRREESGYRPASAEPPPPSDSNDNPDHREDFESLLGKAARPKE
jgi:hypothetical protein